MKPKSHRLYKEAIMYRLFLFIIITSILLSLTAEGEIMAVRHKRYEVEGVQFHPESVATAVGRRIVQRKSPLRPAVTVSLVVADSVSVSDTSDGPSAQACVVTIVSIAPVTIMVTSAYTSVWITASPPGPT